MLSHASIISKILLVLLIISVKSGAQSIGGCDNYSPTEGQTVTCSPTVTPAATSGVQSTTNALNNNITVNVLSGTTLSINGAPIGIGSGSAVNNDGIFNSRQFTNGYGMSSGTNNRSQAGGSTLSNFSTGNITTGGSNASGIYIQASNASSRGNSIFNAGSIQTAGNNAIGLHIRSGSTNASFQNVIENSGAIRTNGATAYGIRLSSVQSIGTIKNSGSIITSGVNAAGISILNTGNITSVIQTGTVSVLGASDALGVAGAASINNYGMICASAIGPRNCIESHSGSGSGIRLDDNGNNHRSEIINQTGALIGATNPSAYAIRSGVQAGLDVVNAGTISAPITAIYFDNIGQNVGSNSLKILEGSSIEGGIRFNPNGSQEKLIFDGYINADFNNLVTGVRVIEATGNANVVMSHPSELSIGSGTINIASGSHLEISSPISDQTDQSSPAQTSIYKIGDGVLILSGDNTFSGDTTLSAGTLAIGNNQAIGFGALNMLNETKLTANSNLEINNALVLNGSTTIYNDGGTLTLSGVISGDGSLNKTGNGVLEIAAANFYTGNTTVSTGALIMSGSTPSNTTVMTGALLQGGGTINGNVTNFGVIQPSFNGLPTHLNINGNYTSNGGVFASALYAQSTQLTADTLTIQGSGNTVTGSTQIGLINTQLLGHPTSGDGILLVHAKDGANTGTNTFYYPNRIAVGAYEYRLVKGGENTPDNWYLRSDNAASVEVVAAYGNKPLIDYVPPEQPAEQVAQAIALVVVPNIEPVPATVTPEPSQRIEVANYPSVASLARLYMLSTVDSFDQRRSDLARSKGSLGLRSSQTSWGRVLGKSGNLRSDDRTQGPGLNARTFAIQVGTDLYRHHATDGAQTWIGPYMTLGQASGNSYSSNGSFNTGNVLLQGYTLGLNATHITAKGLYVDALLQATRFSGVRANSILGASMNTTGWGLTASVETGWKINTSARTSVTPQAQLIFNNTQMNSTADLYANIGIPSDSSLLGRLGVKVSYDSSAREGPATQAWLRLSGLSMLSGKNSQIVFQGPNGNSNVAFTAQTPANWMSIDAGLNIALSASSQLSVTLGYDTSVTNAYRGGYGQIGLQVTF